MAPLVFPSGLFCFSVGGLVSEAKHIIVAANGEYAHADRLLAVLDAGDGVIAADGGANWLAAQGRAPDVLIGDLDSIAPAVRQALERGACRLLRHPPDKDETDTELALLEAVAQGAERITVLGALGGRVDHALANIQLLAMPQLAGRDVRLFDGRSWLFLVRSGRAIHGAAGDTLSLIPLGGAAEGIVTQGLKYPLRGETLALGPARGVSNVFLADEALVTLCAGLLLAIHTPQAHLEEQ